MLKAILVAGARPNFMKVAPIYAEMKRRKGEFVPILLHTGQHYDPAMSDAFFRDLDLPRPDIYLGVGSASHAVQTARIMIAFEPVVLDRRPDWVIVVGDVNSTIACALVCAKLGIRVAHVEAGLRSRDRTMPEEINRILTDAISDLLFTTSYDANNNLADEGIPFDKIRFVGNVMIDSLRAHLKISERSTIRSDLRLDDGRYVVVTLHRPSNVDEKETFAGIADALMQIAEKLPVVFPVHPRTQSRIEEFGLRQPLERSGIIMIEPLGYIDFMRLYSGARIVLTDSGGLQEETTVLGIPCLTLRENTERPITIEMGTNQLIGTKPERLLRAVDELLDQTPEVRDTRVPPLWDGKAAERICNELLTA